MKLADIINNNRKRIIFLILSSLIIISFIVLLTVIQSVISRPVVDISKDQENMIMTAEAMTSQAPELRSSVDITPTKTTGLISSFDDLNLQAAAAYDLKTGDEVFSIGKEKRWPLASTSKIMTAVVAKESLMPNLPIIITPTAVATEGEAGSLEAGERYSLNDMIAAMMIVSSNDAAVALSESLPDGKFIDLMNDKAKSLGMASTHFEDSSGLSSLNQSTLDDMSRLARYVWSKHPEIFKITENQRVRIMEIVSGSSFSLSNINVLSKRSDFLGGKTGFTNDAEQNLVAIFNIKGRPMLIIVFGAPDRVTETEKIINFLKYDSSSN